MKPRVFSRVLQIFGGFAVIITCGCATALVRSDGTDDPGHVYPATAFDGQFLWNAGIKGEPLFARHDPRDRNGPVTRIACGVGAVVDLPFSIVFDTLLLPLDLTRSRTAAEDNEAEDEPE
jgi:uncharacterized protein YceK